MPQTKTTLVILPGWGGTKESWKEFVAIASKKYDVTCLELPGFGAEPCPETVWGVEEYADFVRGKLTEMNHKVILMGHSFGGQVASYLASTSPELIELLVLSGAAVFRPGKTMRRAILSKVTMIGKMIFTMPGLKKFDAHAKKLLYRGIHSPDYNETSGIKREIFKKIIREDLSEVLSIIPMPTLIVWGTRDSYTPVRWAKVAASLIPQAEVHIFQDGKHGLHIQMPHVLFDAIDTYITNHA